MVIGHEAIRCAFLLRARVLRIACARNAVASAHAEFDGVVTASL
jgi:hypothetical protein